jgi:type II secretory pathway pseudopilin PulG
MRRGTAMKKRQGLSLVEVIVSLAILTTLILALLSMMSTAARLDSATRERTVALNALREMAEAMRAYDFGDLYAAYGPTGTFGNTFPIAELADETGADVGTITFLIDETDSSYDAQQFNMPRDLDGDGNATDVDVGTSATYILLPAKLTATWTGMGGRQTLNLYVLLADK